MKRLGRTLLCAALVSLSGVSLGGGALAHEARGATHPTPRAPRGHPRAVERAHALSRWIFFRSDKVQTWLASARNKGKLQQARCIDDKLSELHALERAAEREVASIEGAARIDGLTGAPMTRLRNMATRSRRILARAAACVQPRSVRVRMPTTYSVRVIAPGLPND